MFSLDLFFTNRTRWEAASTSPSPSSGSCPTSSSGPGSWRPTRSIARQPARATSLVMSCPGQRSQWSSTEGSPSSPLSPATEDWHRIYITQSCSIIILTFVKTQESVESLFSHRSDEKISFSAYAWFSSYWSKIIGLANRQGGEVFSFFSFCLLHLHPHFFALTPSAG